MKDSGRESLIMGEQAVRGDEAKGLQVKLRIKEWV
jgi:hypothetical protein